MKVEYLIAESGLSVEAMERRILHDSQGYGFGTKEEAMNSIHHYKDGSTIYKITVTVEKELP